MGPRNARRNIVFCWPHPCTPLLTHRNCRDPTIERIHFADARIPRHKYASFSRQKNRTQFSMCSKIEDTFYLLIGLVGVDVVAWIHWRGVLSVRHWNRPVAAQQNNMHNLNSTLLSLYRRIAAQLIPMTLKCKLFESISDNLFRVAECLQFFANLLAKQDGAHKKK